MDEPKPLASLGPALLARKGGAKPAMRPQAAGLTPMSGAATAQALSADLEDLGWNDMGEDDEPVERTAEVLQLTPSPPSPETKAKTAPKAASKVAPQVEKASPRKTVKSMHEELAERIALEAEASKDTQTSEGAPAAIPLRKREDVVRAVPEPKAASKPVRPVPEAEIVDFVETPTASRRQAEADSRRAAFTLRLDAKRHLKLRLASTVRNLSAQQLVTEALDRFLRDIPEIELLARQVRRD